MPSPRSSIRYLTSSAQNQSAFLVSMNVSILQVCFFIGRCLNFHLFHHKHIWRDLRSDIRLDSLTPTIIGSHKPSLTHPYPYPYPYIMSLPIHPHGQQSQHGLKGNNMTRNAPAPRPRGGFRPNDYGSYLGGISDEDQSTHLNFLCPTGLLSPLRHYGHISLASTSNLFSASHPSYHPLIEPLLCHGGLNLLSPCLEAPANLVPTPDMNENLNERFGRGKAIRDSHMPRALTAKTPVTLNLSIREYAKTADQPTNLSLWTSFREIPSPSEVFDEGRKDHGTTVEIPQNTVIGPYISKEDYLESHYRLLREDAVAPLRDVVSEIQVYPHLVEKDSDNNAYIYEKVTQIDWTACGICSLWSGLYHWPDVRQCRSCSPCHLLLETDREESQLGAVKTVTDRCNSGADSSKGYVCNHLSCSHSRSKTFGRTRAEPTRGRLILWRHRRVRDRSSAGMDHGRVPQWFLRRKPPYSPWTADAVKRKVRKADSKFPPRS